MPSKKSSTKISKNLSLAIAVVILLLAGFVAGTHFQKNKKSAMLFTQQAVTGSLRPTSESGSYTLTMIGVKPHTLIYSGGQENMVGSWTMTDFVTRWAAGKAKFAEHAPSAVLMSHSTVDGKEYAISLELSNPEFDGPGGWVTYDAKIAKDGGKHGLNISSDRYMETFPEILRSPALFIEAKPWW